MADSPRHVTSPVQGLKWSDPKPFGVAGTIQILEGVCSDCPPVGYPTDKTRCYPCPRREKRSGDDRRTEGGHLRFKPMYFSERRCINRRQG